MSDIKIRLDVVTTPDMDTVYVDEGAVLVELVTEAGPSGHPVISVTGTPGQVLGWLITEYTNDDVAEALEILREHVRQLVATAAVVAE